MSKNTCNKGKALHISQWIKGELRDSGVDHANGDHEELELWSAERMAAKKAEVLRRLAASRRDECGETVIVECAETVSVICSSPDDSQVSDAHVKGSRRTGRIRPNLLYPPPLFLMDFYFFFIH